MLEIFDYLRTHGWFTFWVAWFVIVVLGMVFELILKLTKICLERDLRSVLSDEIRLYIRGRVKEKLDAEYGVSDG